MRAVRTYRLRSLAFGAILCLAWGLFAAPEASRMGARLSTLSEWIGNGGPYGQHGYYIVTESASPLKWGAKVGP